MSEIKRYRKKPVVIEAVQWDGTSGGANTVIDWINGHEGCARYRCAPGGCTGTEEGHRVAIETLEGTMSADAGDFIIRGVQGEFYPCKPDIFEKTYESAGGKPEGYPTELADIIIRTLDLAYMLGIDIDAAVQEKLAFNATRGHKHGKTRRMSSENDNEGRATIGAVGEVEA